MNKYIQYGCGFSAPEGWTNYDSSPTLRFERLPLIGKFYTRNKNRFPENVKYGDVVKGLPENANSCNGVYCSHILEHLSYTDFKIAIKNTYGILKPEGVFRLVVPDLLTSAKRYIADQDKSLAPANEFMRTTMLGVENRNKSLKSTIVNLYGNSKHLWMWDYKTLKYELEEVGFKNIRPANFNDSADLAFIKVEEQSRFVDAVAIECSK